MLGLFIDCVKLQLFYNLTFSLGYNQGRWSAPG